MPNSSGSAADRAAVFDARRPYWGSHLPARVTAAQLDGIECIAGCGAVPTLPTGVTIDGYMLFVCSTCDQGTYATRVARKVRAERDRTEVPLLLIADVVGLDLPEVLERYEGRKPWNLDEIELLAALFGVPALSLLEVTK